MGLKTRTASMESMSEWCDDDDVVNEMRHNHMF
jgi:hypothetical protein